MCTNYAPVQPQVLRDVFLVAPPEGAVWDSHVYRDQSSPILLHDDDGGRACVMGSFGMVPYARIRAQTPEGEKVRNFDTMNAKSETVHERSTYKGAWRDCQFCLIPASSFHEPNYEAGPKCVWHRIWPADEPAFGIAGLWRHWPNDTYTFTMFTVAAEGHPVMGRMHKPDKEKRSIVIVPPSQWDDWLQCDNPEIARTFMKLYPAEKMRDAPVPVLRSID
jgi:putative SOS response-associated peptidase YedK